MQVILVKPSRHDDDGYGIPNMGEPVCYTDAGMTPVSEQESTKLGLFRRDEIAPQAIEHAHKIARLTGANKRAGADIHA